MTQPSLARDSFSLLHSSSHRFFNTNGPLLGHEMRGKDFSVSTRNLSKKTDRANPVDDVISKQSFIHTNIIFLSYPVAMSTGKTVIFIFAYQTDVFTGNT